MRVIDNLGRIKSVQVGQSGYSGLSGFSGHSGISGLSGTSGFSGTYSGFSGASGQSGSSGHSGTSAYSGESGYSGFSGSSGSSGSSGYSGTSGQVPAQDLRLLRDIASTGILTGGIISINGGDNTKFDISDGYGYVVDNFSDPMNPVVTLVQWSGYTAIPDNYLALNNQTQLGINSAGSVVQQGGDPFTASQQRDLIILGKTVHPNLSSISSVTVAPNPAYNSALYAHDLAKALGIINIYGNLYTANGTNLKLDKSTGDCYRVGGNYQASAKVPNIVTIGTLSALSFRYRYRNGLGGFGTSAFTDVIDPDQWDDGSTSLQGVPAGKFTIQRIYLFTSGSTYVTYGQAVYDTMDDARAAAFDENPVIDPNFSTDASLRAFLIVQQGTTALNDASKAMFIHTGKLSETSIVGPPGASGISGASGTSAYSGYSGRSGYSGTSAYSGASGASAYSGASGASAYSGYSGTSGASAYSGYSGTSGYSGVSGASAYSGYSGISAYSGISGYSGYSGRSGVSGYSGYSAYSGVSGYSGGSGTSGYSAYSGVSGASGYSGSSGVSGASGYSGTSGYSAYSGSSGTSGYSGSSGTSAFSGASGSSGAVGSGISGTSGAQGSSGTSGVSGYSSMSGTSGFSGVAALAQMPTLIARHSLNQNCQVSFTNINFNTNAISLIPEITHSETVNNERFYVDSTGEYLVIIRLRSDTTDTSARLAVRALIDDSTEITDSTFDTGTGPAVDSNSIAHSFVAQLTSGTYVTIQALKSSAGESWIANGTMVQFVKLTGVSGLSGFSGPSGYSSPSGHSGASGFSGTWSGHSGQSGTSGASGASGSPGYSGTVGESGTSGTSGFSGTFSGQSGQSGFSGEIGPPGPSGMGFSGFSGFSGVIGGTSLEHNTARVDQEFGDDGTAIVGDRRRPFKTIQAAIDACVALSPSANDVYTVDVMPGQYIEDLTMYDYVNVTGAGDNYDTDIQGTVTFGAGVAASSEINDCNVSASNAPCVVVDCAQDLSYASFGTCWLQSFYDDDQAVSCCLKVLRGWAYAYAGTEMDVTKTNSFAGQNVVATVWVTGSNVCRFDNAGGTMYDYVYDEDDLAPIVYNDNTANGTYVNISGGYSEIQALGASPANRTALVYHDGANTTTVISSSTLATYFPYSPHSCEFIMAMSDGATTSSVISISNFSTSVLGANEGQVFSCGATGYADIVSLNNVLLSDYLGNDAFPPRHTALGANGQCLYVGTNERASLFLSGHFESRGFGNSIVPTTGPVYGFSGNDYSVLADSTSSNVTVVLPTWAYEGQVANVKKIASGNSVIVDGVSRTIDGVGYSMSLLGLNESVTLQYYSGFSGWYRIGLGVSGTSGFSGQSGASGQSGTSSYSGYSGASGTSAYSGASGTSAYSGYSGTSAYSGTSGYSAYSGSSGTSGYSGVSSYSGYSGSSGYSGTSGVSGYSGTSGYSGYSSASGYSGYSGYSAASGYSGTSGYSGYSAVSGSSGFSGAMGPGVWQAAMWGLV